MEVTIHKLQHLLLIAVNILTQSGVAIRAQTLDDAVNHCWAEYIVLLKNGTLTLQTISRSCTAVWQLLRQTDPVRLQNKTSYVPPSR